MTFAPIGPNHLTDASKEDRITFFQLLQLANLENSFGFRVDQKLTSLGQEYTHGDRLFHDRFFETSTSFSQMLPKKSSRNGLLSVLYVTCSPGEKTFSPSRSKAVSPSSFS
jgi:hypothetical protein